MSQVYVEKRGETIKIEWQSAEIYIPLREIIEVTDKYMSHIDYNHIVKIGTPFHESKTVIIRTKRLCYVLFSTDIDSILNQINL